MKSMLSEFAFKLPSPEIGDLFGDPVAYVQKLRTHGENLTKALVAALAVIDFEREAANTTLATSDPEGHRQSIIDHHDESVRNLETALEPFKVAGDDAKESTI